VRGESAQRKTGGGEELFDALPILGCQKLLKLSADQIGTLFEAQKPSCRLISPNHQVVPQKQKRLLHPIQQQPPGSLGNPGGKLSFLPSQESLGCRSLSLHVGPLPPDQHRRSHQKSPKDQQRKPRR
jgi:hypothetical protein